MYQISTVLSNLYTNNAFFPKVHSNNAVSAPTLHQISAIWPKIALHQFYHSSSAISPKYCTNSLLHCNCNPIFNQMSFCFVQECLKQMHLHQPCTSLVHVYKDPPPPPKKHTNKEFPRKECNSDQRCSRCSCNGNMQCGTLFLCCFH